MDFKQYQQMVEEFEKVSNFTRREKVINSGLSAVIKSGNVSGNLKTILYNNDIEVKKDSIENLKLNVADVIYNLTNICSALDISIDDILKENIKK